MKRLLVVLCFAMAAPVAVAVAAPASAQVHGCDAADVLCIRHCRTFHFGVDRILCLIDHNIQGDWPWS